MTSDRRKIIARLNRLIETCKNSDADYQQAAEVVTQTTLKALFHRYALQRAKFVTELQAEVRRLGGEPASSGTAVSALHRGWIAMKAATTGAKEHALLAACERWEGLAEKTYEDALHAGLPADLEALVTRQDAEIQSTHTQLRFLEQATV